MVDWEKIAPLIAVVGLLGLPELIVIIAGVGIFGGIIVYELLSFINTVLVRVIIFGVGAIGAYFGFKYGSEKHDFRLVLLGVSVLIISLITLVVYSSGILTSGNTNSYSLLGFSVIPSGASVISGISMANVILQTLFFIGGFGLFMIEIYRVRNN